MERSKPAFRLELREPERFVVFLTLCIIAMNLVQLIARDVAFDWVAYGQLAVVSLTCIAGGHFYRASGRSERIGASLICIGVFSFFSQHAVVFNYLLMPIATSSIDMPLMAMDAAIGFHWPDLVAWMARNPLITDIVRFAYLSTVPQLAALVIILGFAGRFKQLHVFLVSVVITSIISVVFWGYFPTHGAKAYHDVAQDIEMLANPVVTTQYGRELLHMAANGPGLISPSQIKGLIAFPSYHVVLACTAVYAVRGVKWVFPVYLAVNILIIPGAPMHGGHHLMDIPAGIVIFLLGTWLAERTVGAMYRREGLPERDLPIEKPAEGETAAA